MRFLIAIPFYNEHSTVDEVINDAKRWADVLVVDDGSEPPFDRKDVKVIRHSQNMGYGAAVISAFKYAADYEYEYILTMDADGQHHSGDIPAFLERIGQADVISGSRYLLEFPENDDPPEDRKVINQVFVHVIRCYTGYNITDAFCGFKLCRVSSICRLGLDEYGYAFPIQFWMRCWKAGLEVMEVPVKRIYKAKREFPGRLKEPFFRMSYYWEVLRREIGAGCFGNSGSSR